MMSSKEKPAALWFVIIMTIKQEVQLFGGGSALTEPVIMSFVSVRF